MALRCKCGQFITKEGRCNRCEIEFTHVGITDIGDPEYVGSNGESFCAVNNRLQYIHKEKPKEEKKMSFFNVNHKDAGAFDPIAPGKYEALITKVEPTESRAGNPMLKVTLTIRADVEQDFQKRKLFDNLVASEKAMFKFNQVAKAVEIPDGTPVDTMEDFAGQILYKPVEVTVKNEMYEGKPQDRVTFYDVSNFEYEGGDQSNDPFQDDGKPIDISDDDMPF